MIWDHLVVVIQALHHPLWTARVYRRRFADRRTSLRRRRLELVESLRDHALLAGAVAALWWSQGRPPARLGLTLEPGPRFAAAVVLVLAAGGLLAWQLVAVRRAERPPDVRDRLGELAWFVPRQRSELPLLYLVAVTAGIAEELFYRGYLLWYLRSALGLDPWSAVALSSLLFAWAHLYQGRRHLPKVFAVGAAFAGLYLLAGALWLPMVLHAWLDITQGATLAELVGRAPPGSRSISSPPTPSETSSNPRARPSR